MACDGCNCYFSFWAILALLPPPPSPSKSPKNQGKKMPRDIIVLHKYTKNHDHMLYCS